MPFKSAKQKRFFQACLNPSFRRKAKGKCPPIKTIREFMKKQEKTHAKRKKTKKGKGS